MLSNIPNFFFTFGYFNASWTLKADLISNHICKLLNYMQKNSYKQCNPIQLDNSQIGENCNPNFTSGYLQRGNDQLMKQGLEHPYRLYQNYFYDYYSLAIEKVNNDALKFSS